MCNNAPVDSPSESVRDGGITNGLPYEVLS